MTQHKMARRDFLCTGLGATALPLLFPARQLRAEAPFGAEFLNLPKDFRPQRIADSLRPAPLPNTRHVLAELDGPGCIRHIWFTVVRQDVEGNRNVVLRIYWDDEEHPSVEAPANDFFGVCHGLFYYPINSVFLSIENREGFNCYFPMPFRKKARIEIETGPGDPKSIFFIIDWHRYPEGSLQEDLRFHAAWRREFPTQHYGEEYLVMDAVGRGRLMGLVYGVRLYDDTDRWSHGGAENLYIDGETIGENGTTPDYIRGTGGEDTFGTSYGGVLHQPESNLYEGLPYYVFEDVGGAKAVQRVVGYRFFVQDPIPFERSLHFRFGCMANDICSTAYWYQTEPHRPFVKLPEWSKMAPGTELLRGTTDLLIQDGGTGPQAVLADADDGEWWLCGPFENAHGQAMSRSLPPEQGVAPDTAARYDGGFEENSPYRNPHSGRPDQNMARWVRRRAVHGFVDLNHVFRPWTRGVAVTPPAAACAQTTIFADQATPAKLYLAWDDRLILHLNGDPPRDLGDQPTFKQQALDIRLQAGANRLLLKLNNIKGKNWGGWCFTCRVVLPSGKVLIPAVEQAADEPGGRRGGIAGADRHFGFPERNGVFGNDVTTTWK